MEKNSTANQLLLLEDVVNLGRKGELVTAKPGFVRNFLLPQKKAVIADKRTIRMQELLREERTKQAEADRKQSETLAARIKGKTFLTKVKTDKEGHLFGSVSVIDIVRLLETEEGIHLDRRQVTIGKPIKQVGTYEINLRLKEDVPGSFNLKVIGENQVEAVKHVVDIVDEEEEAVSEEGESLPSAKELKTEVRDELEERTKD